MRVLVVDDEHNITGFLSVSLSREGHEVRVGYSAEEFLRQARAFIADIILLDIMMPGEMSGLDALRLLRRESDVPVILITAKGEEVDKVLGLEYADDYVVKPFGVPEIRAPTRRRRPAPSAPATCSSTPKRARRASPAGFSRSRSPSTASSPPSPPTPAASSPATNWWSASGARTSTWIRAPWTCTSARCAASSSRTRPNRRTCSPFGEWASGTWGERERI